MIPVLNNIRLGAIAIVTATVALIMVSPVGAFAQMPSAATTSLAEPTVKALQEALNKQGIAVKVDGVLDEETRAAIRTFQSQHHVPVTGEADKTTLDKLGISQNTAPTESPTTAQAAPTSASVGSSPAAQAASRAKPGQVSGGMMMDCSAMQSQMESMMKTMHGMMQMMQTQMHAAQPQPAPR